MRLIAPLLARYDSAVRQLTGRLPESAVLVLVRLALGGVFWRSGRSKVVEGSWLEISDTTRFLFETDYSGVPFPPAIAAPMAAYAEHLFPILLVLGLATRFSALALLGMTMVIQLFVYPEAWWQVHVLWTALAAVLVVRGGGLFSADHALGKVRQ